VGVTVGFVVGLKAYTPPSANPDKHRAFQRFGGVGGVNLKRKRYRKSLSQSTEGF
jgi:hypothetical protein